MDFGLFYFADGVRTGTDQYRLLLEGARFADTNGFSAVWTPERHFHEFGGRYPNPAVTAAAVAAVTENVAIRAGSVVAPLHHPARIAEEWAVVDNLSGGRAGVSFAPGWHVVDFALRPENYADRRQVTMDTIDTVRRLWRQEEVELVDGAGESVKLRTHPAPVQPELPTWLTSSGNPETFRQAGDLGVGILTHLLGQSLDDLVRKVAEYREHYARAHNGTGHVALMLHTFVGEDRAKVREVVHDPFTDYLRSSLGLVLKAAEELMPGIDPDQMDPEDIEFLLEISFERYFETGGLFGTVDDGMALLGSLERIGVDEVACLIDFVPDTDAVLDGLRHLARLKQRWEAR
ncbi:LLM class flavin-dependent oxidoreductase [Nonomuraea deserti]|uniref:LLM class flavin-dependent oxidoreductase n=1 Tax=Nonomuraea deserti TaxID=1848322 RepID=A0A4R4UBC2_9ACTN|nr:MupA/Atu3671 family FMN-dependent luciferase-like monooxygenase [Nonomuraea deserti]TDC85712.1 LLM class flavin-dependent oxidoreductase [Nonomuraea deserti]